MIVLLRVTSCYLRLDWGFSHLVTSRMFTNYHYSALTTLFYRETFAYSRAIDPNHVNDTHKQQELSLT